MTDIIIAIVCLILALLGIVLRKTYFALPASELKRRARYGDQSARQLYRVVSYGNSLRGLLWLYIGLTSAIAVILLARSLPIWLGILVIGPLLWIAFSLIPAARTSSYGQWLTGAATPIVAWLLNYLHPSISRGADAIETRFKAPRHSGLFEKEDLVELITHQPTQSDSRISLEELEIARRALEFGDVRVKDVLLPSSRVKALQPSDVIGPILIDELHKKRQPYTPVREGKKGPVIGTLAFDKLGLHSKGTVRELMDNAVYYLHEDDTLTQALYAFHLTNRPFFIVIDNAEEYIGIITVQTMIEQLLGHVPGENFDQYTDPSAVVARRRSQREQPEPSVERSVKTDAEVLE